MMNELQKWLRPLDRVGKIKQVIGMQLIAEGPPQVFTGEYCEIVDTEQELFLPAVVIGFTGNKVYLLPLQKKPITQGAKVFASGQKLSITAHNKLPGHFLNAFAEPLAGKITVEDTEQLVTQREPINPLHRLNINQRLFTQVHAIDVLLPLGQGQRIGLFAGSGVGKSTLLHRIVNQIDSDINIIALIGERGREVSSFVNNMDEETRKKSIIIAACSDELALVRRQAAFTAITLAEFFCRQTKKVLFVMDSVTRLAMAQREIGLCQGEPPTARGYTPSTFSLLPELVERAGNFQGQGSITAIFTVLVDGDDFNEPIADTMRSLLDGHIVLTRELAQRGHFPAIDILQSVSRLESSLFNREEQQLAMRIRQLFSLYQQYQELISIGAYKGGNEKLDYTLHRIEALTAIFCQASSESIAYPMLQKRILEILQ